MMQISNRAVDPGSTGAVPLAAAAALAIIAYALAGFSGAFADRAEKKEEQLVELIIESNTQTLTDFPLKTGDGQ